jgi:hypothetical protein
MDLKSSRPKTRMLTFRVKWRVEDLVVSRMNGCSLHLPVFVRLVNPLSSIDNS